MNNSYTTYKKLKAEPFEKRLANTKTLRLKYPSKVPVIVYTKNNHIPITEKSKYLVEKGVSMAEFMHVLRKYIKIQNNESIFLFTEKNTIPASSVLISAIYDEHKNDDGFLYLEYNVENTFGG